MFFIVTATFLAGLVTTKLLMMSGVDLLWLRYALAICAAYLTFLVFIRLWIWYVCQGGGGGEDGAIDLFVRQMDKVEWVELGGGGEFGGGGASGTWEATGEAADGAPVELEISTAPSKVVSSPSGGGSDKSGCLSFDIGGDEGCFIVILLALFAGVLLIAGGYVIYAAPAILGEAVFEVLLAAALVRRTKKLAATGWAGSVFKSTVWIFLAVLAFAVVLGWYAQRSCPEARRIRDAINCGAVVRESRRR